MRSPTVPRCGSNMPLSAFTRRASAQELASVQEDVILAILPKLDHQLGRCLLGLLVDREMTERESRRLKDRLAKARLRQAASDFLTPRRIRLNYDAEHLAGKP
jgi:hypothetical protein